MIHIEKGNGVMNLKIKQDTASSLTRNNIERL